jgi:hypothetical protein
MNPITKSQRRAMILVGIIAVLGLPAYFIIAVLTIPIGVGLLMVMDRHPWILNLYPFLFAGQGPWNAPVYHLNGATSLALTILQWALMAWLIGLALRNATPRWVTLGVFGSLLGFGCAIAAVLHAIGIEVITAVGGHM